MPDRWSGLTQGEVRARIAMAGIEIAEARIELVRSLVNMALEPIRAADGQDLRDVEPAVQFDVTPAPPEARL